MAISHLIATVLFALFLSFPAGAVEVIANKSVPLAKISLGSARAVFGMRQVKWPDGSLIRVFVLPDSNPVHGALCKERLNLYPYQLRQSWDRLIFSGMAQAPIEVASEAEMLASVAATPGAIGYLARPPQNEKVKVLNVE
ncbi:MAG: hypothetical protein AB1421_13230 [Pseudomonadota bacterium]